MIVRERERVTYHGQDRRDDGQVEGHVGPGKESEHEDGSCKAARIAPADKRQV